MSIRENKDVRVFVAEGSRMAKNPHIVEAAAKIGEYLGKHQYVYLQGCNEQGLMGVTYKEFIKYNKKTKLVDLNVVYFDNYHEGMIGERIPAKCLNTRLKVFADNTDVIVVLPGANGTLHEFATFFEINRMYPGAYEIILVNIDGFYDHLIDFIRVQEDEGLCMPGEFDERVKVVTSAEETVECIRTYRRKPVSERFVSGYIPAKENQKQ